MATKDTAARVTDIGGAWEKMRPRKSFFGMTLADFRKEVQPFMDARAEIADLQRQMQHAFAKRDMAQLAATKAVQNVINAVRGDVEEGQEGELYVAMGYVPKSQRSSGLKRALKEEGGKAAREPVEGATA